MFKQKKTLYLIGNQCLVINNDCLFKLFNKNPDSKNILHLNFYLNLLSLHSCNLNVKNADRCYEIDDNKTIFENDL